jgi:hypothetical protein
MSRWPPIIWVMVFFGSLLILLGYDGAEYNPQALIPGIALIVGALGLSFYVAFGRLGDRPAPRGVAWLIPATAVFYVICAVVALLSDGGAYAVAALGAGMIPLTAATLITATARAKTTVADGGRDDATSADHTDPFPGIGMDDSTPLGDTPEHSDAERVATPDPRSRRRR